MIPQHLIYHRPGLAIALAERMPTEGRERAFAEILDHAIRNQLPVAPILRKLGRTMNDAERILYCEKLQFSTSRELLRRVGFVARGIFDVDKRLDTQKKVERGFLYAGYPEEVTLLTEEDIFEWVKEMIPRSERGEELIRKVVHFFPYDFAPLLAQMRTEAITTGYESGVQRNAKVMGKELSAKELLRLRDVLKQSVLKHRRHERAQYLYELPDFATGLPERNRVPFIRWVVEQYTLIGETDQARKLLKDLPERERPRLAEKILARELGPGDGVHFRRVWETEKYLGRPLTEDEVRRRLAFRFSTDRDERLPFILRLSEEERVPYLEELIGSHIQAGDLEGAIAVAAIVQRELSLPELFLMLSSAEHSCQFWSGQRLVGSVGVEQSKEQIRRIAEHIASLPVPARATS